LQSEHTLNGRYKLHDLLGKVVAQGNTTGSRTRLSLGHLPKGIYLIRYELESQAAVRKVVVE